ncbi:hypothetical protein F4802DRAFT_620796 [Xylaria palmicola]|nr:hypothetical protein F4802DRAFT_620796 [Xylaria palmicola]
MPPPPSSSSNSHRTYSSAGDGAIPRSRHVPVTIDYSDERTLIVIRPPRPQSYSSSATQTSPPSPPPPPPQPPSVPVIGPNPPDDGGRGRSRGGRMLMAAATGLYGSSASPRHNFPELPSSTGSEHGTSRLQAQLHVGLHFSAGCRSSHSHQATKTTKMGGPINVWPAEIEAPSLALVHLAQRPPLFLHDAAGLGAPQPGRPGNGMSSHTQSKQAFPKPVPAHAQSGPPGVTTSGGNTRPCGCPQGGPTRAEDEQRSTIPVVPPGRSTDAVGRCQCPAYQGSGHSAQRRVTPPHYSEANMRGGYGCSRCLDAGSSSSGSRGRRSEAGSRLGRRSSSPDDAALPALLECFFSLSCWLTWRGRSRSSQYYEERSRYTFRSKRTRRH